MRGRLKFAICFGLLLSAYYALVLLPMGSRALYGYLQANAWASNLLLHGLAQRTQLAGLTIRDGGFAISLRRGCDAVEPAWLFCAAVLAFPAPWSRKWRMVLAGSAFILALNFIRIVTLFFIGRNWPALFPPAHLEIWPAVFMIAVIGLWLVWIRSVHALA